MEKIELVQDIESLKITYEKVFLSNDPFINPFKKNISSSLLIFYPTAGYHLTETQYLAVIRAAQSHNDEGFFVSVIEHEESFFHVGEHWWCEFPSYEEYLNLPLVLENAIYSKNFYWGGMVSHEDHAVFAGGEGFIHGIKNHYPQWVKDLHKFREIWCSDAKTDWAINLLKYV